MKKNLLYIKNKNENIPKNFYFLKNYNWNLLSHKMYEINKHSFDKANVIFLPSFNDQIFLQKIQKHFLSFLEKGGHLIINGHIAIPWLPFLNIFQPINPKPYTNYNIRFRNPLNYFKTMEKDFHYWDGVLGQYSRGWSEMPKGAIWLTDIGPENDPKPVDWLWQYPNGGKVFMHNGDNINAFPHPNHKKYKTQNLLIDVCLAIIE